MRRPRPPNLNDSPGNSESCVRSTSSIARADTTWRCCFVVLKDRRARGNFKHSMRSNIARSEEHTTELQTHVNLVCRLLIEKEKKKRNTLLIKQKKKKQNKKKKKKTK